MTAQKTMIVNKNDEKRLITSAVLIPDYEDCDAPRGEKTLSSDEIQDFAHKYMERYRISDKNHDYFQTKEEVATPVESWIVKEDTSLKTLDNEEITYPEGTWFVTMKVHDDNVWAGVQDGTYNGLSVTVTSESVADQLVAGKSRVLIKDVPDPVAATVALVDKPCVYGAKFCSVKSANKSSNSRDESFEGKRDKISAALRKDYEDVYIELTYDDKVIYHSWKDETYYEVPYSIDVEGVVQLGEPKEVQVEYVAKKMIEKAEIAKKAGRSISESTLKKIKNAFDSLGKLIDKANTERDETQEANKGDKMTNKDNNEDKKEEYVKKSDLDAKFEAHEKNIAKAVKEAMETDEDKRNKKIASMKSELEELGVDTSKMDFSPKSNEDDEEDSSDENPTDETVEGASKSLDNHESGEEKTAVKNLYEDDNRDIFGRVIK